MSTALPYIVTGSGLVTGGRGASAGRVGLLVDVLLYNTTDGGEISYVNGLAVMDDGLYAAAYLSLFGGMEQDSGLAATESKQWWGNLGETQPERRYRSETQYLLNTLPAIPANLKRLDDAAGRDLGWMVDTSLANAISVLTTMPGLNRVRIETNIEIADQRYELVFDQRWGQAA